MEATLHRDLYIEPSWFAKERDRIFAEQWTCVGREDELLVTGSFEQVVVAGQSIIVVRGDDWKLRAFHNVCRHRGCELVDSTDPEQQRGQFLANIRCPYHSWTYRLDGQLHHTPHLEVDKHRLGLHEIPLSCWAGFVFLRIGGDAALDDQLGPVPERLARYPLEDLVGGWQATYDIAANWKVILENYNECYHCAGVHPELCRIVPEFRRDGGAHLDWKEGIPQKPGTNTFTITGTTTRAAFPGLNEAEKERHFGEVVFPNLLLSLSMDHVAVFLLRPLGPERTAIDFRLLFHPDARNHPEFDPRDAAEFWDLVNRQDWSICERVQRGMHARPFTRGLHAPMEDLSLDIRDYVSRRLGTEVLEI